MSEIILGIESSCDDTSAAVIKDGYLLSNVLASQDVHKAYGGVIPELASRAHQVNIVPVVSEAITRAGIKAEDITAIAFTRGPGLLGSLLVGTSFAKGLAMALDKPLVEVNHLQGHILANFIKQHGQENRQPEFPYLCLLVSGGNSQIVRVNSPLEYDILGQTIDDAVGSMKLFRPCPYDTVVTVDKGLEIRFTDAGHLLGSASIEVWVTEDKDTEKLVFSGDIGNLEQPLLRDPTYLTDADYVIMESTYGNRSHGDRPNYIGDLVNIIQRTFDRGGNLVIPSFAVGRTQELLYLIRIVGH